MTLQLSDTSHSSSESDIITDPLHPPAAGYKMMFVINMEHQTAHGIITKKVADASVILYRQLLHASRSTNKKLLIWEQGGEKKEIFLAANQSQLKVIEKMSHFLQLPTVYISHLGVTKKVTRNTRVIAMFGSNDAVGHVSEELYPYY